MRADSAKSLSMDIGDYGWIECAKEEEKKYTGWFLRIKVGGKVIYVNRNEPDFKFPDTYITNSQNKDYVLRCGVKAIDSLKYDFEKETVDEILRRTAIECIEKQIFQLKISVDYDNRMLQQKMNMISRLSSDLENMISGKKYSYVYGIHTLDAKKEYGWENVDSLNINVGDVIEVETSNGVEKVFVTRLEESISNKGYKKVIRKTWR